ncbi:molybdopterin dehydrogenase [Rhodococcus sp. Leaf7]|uniref:FAD binding domain-containing protein n=1 Tax=unclassified Rhodococcus (in: high G+C Gram-positive bacteria) TaxID=192944 RepID=UPI0006FD8A8E|nr:MULTISPECIES: xanthine dehydrogenase family protein subunit M [unclassified Rhodococcus (in: high G+C Gram-positive bacteria)]KQU06573.1 molybdopterin dehydrogenase [Rhodococcus sp. Leaf7]KQU42091.1 molybdopterin dehydrogenase [Rhodococcus sp. Leaf247]
MKTFAYDRAEDAASVAPALAQGATRVLAGGTNLVDLMKLGVETPDRLIDITGLALAETQWNADSGLRVGALVRNSDLAADPVVRSQYPVLSRALLSGASGQLRNMATTGGNLFQRTRCPYFMNVDTACNKREPGSGCSALEGDRRNAAVLGASQYCIATHPSDMAVGLAVLDPTVGVVGTDGIREIRFADLHRLPESTPERDSTLRDGEWVSHLDIPPLPSGARSTYRKVRDRASYAFAVVSVAAVVVVENGVFTTVRIALGGVAHKPWRATIAENDLLGSIPSRAAVVAAMEHELGAAHTFPDNNYKMSLVASTAASTVMSLSDVAADEARR